MAKTRDQFLLHEPDLMLALLTVAAGGKGGTLADALARLGDTRRAAGAPPLQGEDASEVLLRLGIALEHLASAHLLRSNGSDRFFITHRGKDVLTCNRQGVDDSVLLKFPEYRRWLNDGTDFSPQDNSSRIFEQGWGDFQDGQSLTDNPYRFDSAQHLMWENGWSAARDTFENRSE